MSNPFSCHRLARPDVRRGEGRGAPADRCRRQAATCSSPRPSRFTNSLEAAELAAPTRSAWPGRCAWPSARLDERVQELSGGQRLAEALAAATSLLLLD